MENLNIMKKNILTFLVTLFVLTTYAQKPLTRIKETAPADTSKVAIPDTTIKAKPDATGEAKSTPSSNDTTFGWNDRFAFFVGGGFSVTQGDLYNDPVINPTNSFVEIESSKKLRTSLTLGIVFSPWVYEVYRTVYISDKQGKKIDTAILVEHIPKILSFALFMNPISLTKLNDNGFTNSVDLGFGIGWREGDFLIMATVDFFSIRQPRQYFVDQFKDKNTTYVVNGQTQNTVDITNNNIFHNVIVPSVGIKMCYAFNLTKSFYSNAQQLTK